MAIKIAYFIRIPNVGDRINPLLIEALTGQQALWTRDYAKPHLLAVGSIVNKATPESVVWGSGVLHPDLGVGVARVEKIHALRGPLSWRALRNSGLKLRDIPFGDPAYLAPSLLGVRRQTKAERVGMVAHYTDREHPQIRRLLAQGDVIDLNVHDEPTRFLQKMAECAAVVSSSLHGLIFAEALGIPNLWIKAGSDIAGDEFKFHDWFETTSAPQKKPREIDSADTPNRLANIAELHGSQIDCETLAVAFPSTKVEPREIPSSRRPLERPIPVFLISYNRAAMLRRSMAGIKRFSRTTDIIIHDNGSTDTETLALLNELEAAGIRVFRYNTISHAEELNSVNETVQAFFADWPEPGRYVVSDCDIDLSVAAPNVLDAYDYLLNRFRQIECVGPMLRITDVPRSYPLYNHMMNRHIEQFWQHAPTIVDTPLGQIAVQECLIDTTFALHRAGEPFRRLKRSLRVYEPYEALHLDWYRTEHDDDTYTVNSNPGISHWNNRIAREQNKNAELEWEEFIAIRRREDGCLESHKIQLR